ncbi:MAG: NADH-quinone oxidoreductase subunit H [Bryobacterales bacterium]|jgi:NADH-quinone oxidoreductase subunit H|nr:NADH-quinone oxidoreductase subunit H [Bryobacterales bacterium]
MQAILNHPWFVPLLTGLCIIALFPLVAGYLVLLERKVLADMQARLGPMRVGPHGFLQPIADALKLLLKEDTIPRDADRRIFWVAPVIAALTALSALAFIPFGAGIVVADVNVGILAVSAMSSVGIIGIILGGWSSNSHYSLLGSLRSAAQLVSYEVALGLGLLAGVMAVGTLSMVEAVENQAARQVWGIFDNFGLMFISFAIYFIASIAETNRAPFDLPEAESELVAGYMTEYSGFRWALFFLAEYAAMCVVAGVAVTVFFGGWMRPFASIAWLDWPLHVALPALLFAGVGIGCLYLVRRLKPLHQRVILSAIAALLVACGALFAWPAAAAALAGPFWFFFKMGLLIYVMIWMRGTFPRLRYDQLMSLGWFYLIPIGMLMLLLHAIVGVARG